jgi:opacity protein-like surface antigen
MRTFRRVLIATLAIVAMLAAAPAFAQTTQPAPAPVQKQQGLGIFLQGGYTRSSAYGPDADFFKDFHPQGVILGIGFGGNKSGAFGVGVDLNYVFTNETDPEDSSVSVKTQYLNIPVYGRFNIGGHSTKNAPTFYIPVGWYFDVLLSSKGDNGTDTVDLLKDVFEGFQTGPLVGAGFEVARIGVEARFQWSIKQLLKSTDFELVDAKQFTFIVLFKVRLN